MSGDNKDIQIEVREPTPVDKIGVVKLDILQGTITISVDDVRRALENIKKQIEEGATFIEYKINFYGSRGTYQLNLLAEDGISIEKLDHLLSDDGLTKENMKKFDLSLEWGTNKGMSSAPLEKLGIISDVSKWRPSSKEDSVGHENIDKNENVNSKVKDQVIKKIGTDYRYEGEFISIYHNQDKHNNQVEELINEPSRILARLKSIIIPAITGLKKLINAITGKSSDNEYGMHNGNPIPESGNPMVPADSHQGQGKGTGTEVGKKLRKDSDSQEKDRTSTYWRDSVTDPAGQSRNTGVGGPK